MMPRPGFRRLGACNMLAGALGAALGVVLGMAVAGAASAQPQPFEPVPDTPEWNVDISAGAVSGFSSTGREANRVNATPWADFNWRNRVYGNPLDGLGYNIVADDGLRAGVQLRPHYCGKSAIEGLDLPDLGADMAVYGFVRIPGNISVGGRVMRDISGQTDGTTYYASASHQGVTRIGLLQSTLYARGGDARSNDAYVGVDADAASVTGLTPYAPGSGVRNTGVAFLMLTPIGDRWAVATFANAERAMSDVADSPLIQARDEQEMAIAGGF